MSKIINSGKMESANAGFGRGELRVFDSVEDLSTELVDHVAELSETTVKERGSFSLVLSGGGDLLSLLQNLSRGPYLTTVDWSKWYVFLVEDNVVPKTHPDSHYRLAKEAFLSKVPVAPSKIVPAVPAAYASSPRPPSSESVAEDYEFRIRQLVRSRTVDVSMSNDCPRFDLILLLLGSDGRVAALYPDHPVSLLGFAGDTEYPWVAPVNPTLSRSSPSLSSKKMITDGVTMTLPVINSAAQVAVIAIGTAVAEALASALGRGCTSSSSSSRSNPAKMISPTNGRLVWFADSGAASLLGPGFHF